MKVEKNTSTKVTLTNKEVTEIIKKHLKDAEGIDITHIDYYMDVNDTLDLSQAVCTTSVTKIVK